MNTVEKGGTTFVQVEIPFQHFELLSRWASVGRSIDAAINSLDELSTQVECDEPWDQSELDRMVEQADFTMEELKTLKQPLSAVASACLEARLESESKK